MDTNLGHNRTFAERRRALMMTPERSLQFIQLVKNRECLWKRTQNTYINRSHVADAWKEVSMKMGLPVEFLQQKWKSLSGSFRHVRAVHDRNMAAASDPSTVRPPTWFAYAPMLFLNESNRSQRFRRSKSLTENKQSFCQVKAEANSTVEEHGESEDEQEESEMLADETKYSDEIATAIPIPETEGAVFGALLARKLDNMSPIRRKRMILKFEKELLAEEEARFVEKYGPL
ncbi:uncharacterized protein LOC125952614 [Anopheles darlingi]|uniref:uncharacterized protein LOC125952614 n=1 Tax=Anopheles darlingi TaxID=43151 RepID=UPI00210064C7|nr:uncharacterized protein LOC125952614 [Anopheles darlingi]